MVRAPIRPPSIWEIDDYDDKWHIDNILDDNATKYAPDKFGLLQPVMCLFRAGSIGGVKALPNEPGTLCDAPHRSTSSAQAPAKDPMGDRKIQLGVKRSVKGVQSVLQTAD